MSYILASVMCLAVSIMAAWHLWAVALGETSCEGHDFEVYRKVAKERGEVFVNSYDLGYVSPLSFPPLFLPLLNTPEADSGGVGNARIWSCFSMWAWMGSKPPFSLLPLLLTVLFMLMSAWTARCTRSSFHSASNRIRMDGRGLEDRDMRDIGVLGRARS